MVSAARDRLNKVWLVRDSWDWGTRSTSLYPRRYPPCCSAQPCLRTTKILGTLPPTLPPTRFKMARYHVVSTARDRLHTVWLALYNSANHTRYGRAGQLGLGNTVDVAVPKEVPTLLLSTTMSLLPRTKTFLETRCHLPTLPPKGVPRS